MFCWTPSECQGPGVYTIPIYVVDYCNNEENDLGFVKVTVNEVNQPPWLQSGGGTAYAGRTNFFPLCSGDPDCPANPLSYTLLAPVPSGMTIDTSTGVIRWAPTVSQVGTTNVKVRLCDGGSPNYCVTNTTTIGVTAHVPYSLKIQQASPGIFQFTILAARTDVDYILQGTPAICSCPCQPVWQNVTRVSPTTSPFTFFYSPINLNQQPISFFRLTEAARTAGPGSATEADSSPAAADQEFLESLLKEILDLTTEQ